MYQNAKRCLFVTAVFVAACGSDEGSSSMHASEATPPSTAGRGVAGMVPSAATPAAGSGSTLLSAPMTPGGMLAPGGVGPMSAPAVAKAGSAAGSSAAAGSGAGSVASIVASAAGVGGGGPAAIGCGGGEMCKAVEAIPTPVPLKFCSADPAAVLPPSCTMPNTSCGTNGKGMCLDAAAIGFAGTMFCVYTTC